jgi:V-type H+-transporting ATPase subunit a
MGIVVGTCTYVAFYVLLLNTCIIELSEVLWEMVLRQAFSTEQMGAKGAILIYAIFFAFIVLTVCILVLMEGLSAFLHALRLHWYEKYL